MSDKVVKNAEKKSLSKAVKWSLGVLAILVIVAGTIVASVKVTEIRGQADIAQLQNILEKISMQNARIDALEKLPSAVSTTSKQLEAASHGLNTLSDNFERLNEEAGHNKVPALVEQTSGLSHRIEALEETQSNELLILSLALMIKENALYHQNFVQEAEILAKLAQNTPSIHTDVETINLYKNETIADNMQLATQFFDIIKDFNFNTQSNTASENAEDDLVSKGIKVIKKTVSGMRFDRVIVLKKEKKTDEQKKLLADLTKAVRSYNYPAVLDIINTHPELNAAENQDFSAWQEKVKIKLSFDKAVSHLITEQLSALREDVKNDTIKIPAQQSPLESDSPAQNETSSIPEAEEIVND